MGVDINWNLFNTAPDVGERVQQGMARGIAQAEHFNRMNALAAYARNPDDPRALRAIQALDPQTAASLEEQAYRRSERQRTGQARSALGDYLLGSLNPPVNALIGAGTGPTPVAPPMPANALSGLAPPKQSDRVREGQRSALTVSSGPSFGGRGAGPDEVDSREPTMTLGEAQQMRSPRDAAYERLVRLDPEAALEVQQAQTKLTRAQVETFETLNDAAMQILGGVNDQATFAAAKQRAHQLYATHGVDASHIDALPDEYSPQLIESLRLQGMETKEQLAAIRQQSRLDWDIEDDKLDNRRADDDTAARAAARREQLRISRRRLDRPTATRAAPRPTKATVIGRLLDKQARGEALTPAENDVLTQHGSTRETYPDGTTIEMPDGSLKVRKHGRWVASDG